MKSAPRISLLAAVLSLAGVAIPAIVVPHVAWADSAGEPSPEFKAVREQGIEFHDAAREGNEEAAGAAIDQLARYLKRFPEDGEAWAYLGSATALMGRGASTVVNRMRYTNRGLRHLDRAFDVAPRNFAVRFIRARVHSSLPKMFNRSEAATEDMLALDEIFRVEPSPRQARFMVEIYEDLQHRAPEAGPWGERLERARALSGEQQGR